MISLVVPTYNERQNISELVERAGKTMAATGEEYELIIVDDHSPDGTAEEVRRLQGSRPWLKLLVRENDRDLSTAVLAGWRMACGDVWGCMDGDLQHPPEQLSGLLERLRVTGAEIVIASRYVPEGGVSEWNFARRFVSWVAAAMAALLLPGRLRRVRDPMSGFFILKRSVVEGVELKPLGYKILLEVLARGLYHRTAEVGYVFEERVSGSSKMGPLQVWHYFLQLLRLCYETGEARRIMKSALAWLAGILLNVSTLLWLCAPDRLGAGFAAFLAGEAGLVATFTLIELLGLRVQSEEPLAYFGHFLHFQAKSALGLAANIGLVWLIAGFMKLPLVVAGLGGAIPGALVTVLLSAARGTRTQPDLS